ncbi:hypothetical protein ACFLS8_05295 [Chloroflexota bacterium]
MKKLLLILPLTAILLLSTAGTALADEGEGIGEGIGAKCGQAGKSNTGHMYLYEKDPADWSIVNDGAWAKMKYNLSGDELKFVFNGHDLVQGESYSLIYYPDPWPGEGLIILGEGTVNEEGNVHIMGSVDTGNLPIATDKNNILNPEPYEWINEDYNGAKIWLVLSGDLPVEEDTTWIGWQPESYLFEYDLINFSDSGDELVKGNSGKSGKGPKPDKEDNPNKPDKEDNPNKPDK